MTDQTAATATILATFGSSLAALEAAIPSANGFIMAWPTGLGVRWENGAPIVCGVLHADRVTDADMTHTIRNGTGEVARLTTRKEALEAAAAGIRESIAYVNGLAAAAA